MKTSNDVPDSLKLVLLHDNEAALLCAERLCESLKTEHPVGCRLESVSWSFAVLESPVVSHAAQERVREADMIFCARSDMGPLPPLMKDWFHQMAATEAVRDRALVLLHPAASDRPLTSLPTWLFLKGICSDSGMDFFARACDPCFSGQGSISWTELRFGDPA